MDIQEQTIIESEFYNELYQALMQFKDKELTVYVREQITHEIMKVCEKYKVFKRDKYSVNIILEKIFDTSNYPRYICHYDIVPFCVKN